MRIVDLHPECLKLVKGGWSTDVVLAEAQGVMFLCPKCFEANKGEVGTHRVICWFRGRGVPDDQSPGPGRWDVSGTGFSDLTLKPSVFLSGADGCQWHGWITNGEAK